MLTHISVLVSILLCLASSSKDAVLPYQGVWSVYKNGSYRCGPDIYDAITCDKNEAILYIQNCYCLFFDKTYNQSYLGTCLFSCFYQLPNKAQRRMAFYSIEHYSVENASLLNEVICNDFSAIVELHRKDRFCGRCGSGFGLAVYSYHYIACIKCTDYGYRNWIQYFAVSLLPLTFFVFLLILLKINVPSSHLNGTVFMMQCLTVPALLRSYDAALEIRLAPNYAISGANVVYVLFGMFNLDFLRDIYPYFCLHPKLNILAVMSLDYIVALYPFLLILLTYILLKLYDNNHTLMVIAWKPFKWCLWRKDKKWKMKGTLIQTFASLILLSSVKILGITLDILSFSIVYAPDGSYRKVFYYDGTIDYLQGQHLYYASFSILICFIFVGLPFLLLVVYPCSVFQGFLNFLDCRGSPALHIFMDVFQGSYKISPYDLRYFSVFHILLRALLLVIVYFFKSMFIVPAAAFLMLLAAAVLAIVQPYQNHTHNKLDIISLVLLAMFFGAFTASIFTFFVEPRWKFAAIASIAGTVIVMFLYALIILTFNKVHGLLKNVFTKLKLDLFIKKHKQNDTGGLERFDENGDLHERSSLLFCQDKKYCANN